VSAALLEETLPQTLAQPAGERERGARAPAAAAPEARSASGSPAARAAQGAAAAGRAAAGAAGVAAGVAAPAPQGAGTPVLLTHGALDEALAPAVAASASALRRAGALPAAQDAGRAAAPCREPGARAPPRAPCHNMYGGCVRGRQPCCTACSKVIARLPGAGAMPPACAHAATQPWPGSRCSHVHTAVCM